MNTKELTKIFKALSNENRLEIYLELLKNSSKDENSGGYECFVTEIINKFNIGAPTISHHLKELSNAGLISTERRGKFLVAILNTEILENVGKYLIIEKFNKIK